jgi:ABC-type spermidine/putrescine transport system permease subunit II
LLLGFSSAIIATLVGMAASRALINHQIKHKVAWDLLIMLALIVPPTVCGVGMRTLFLKLGFANTWGSVLFSLVIANIPYCTKIMMDITSTVGISFEQEARVLGLGKVRAYFVGTVPLIVPGILTSLGFGFMTAVNQYFYVAFMGAGRIKSLIVSIVLPAVSHSAMPVAATYCVFFILFNVVIFAFFQFLAKKAQKAVGKNVGA